MGMRTDWVAAKAKAKRMNNGQDVKFAKDLKLGAALDKVDATEKAYVKLKGNFGPEWAKALDAWLAAGAAAHTIATTYFKQLDGLKVNSEAKHVLDSHISMAIFSKTNHIKDEGERLESKLKQHRKK
jgi:hypothetical protein